MSEYSKWEKILGKELFGELESLVYLGGKQIVNKATFKKEYDEFMDKIPNSVSNEAVSILYKHYQTIVRHYK